MAKFNVVDMNGQHVSEIELSDAVFGITPNEKAVHIAVVNFLANQRQGTQNTKIRMEVSGGGKKPWRQKGTGHARQGSIRAPQWTHGGTVFAPKPRDYRVSVNKKVKRVAMKSALSSKVNDNAIVVFDALDIAAPKTKEMVKVLANIKADNALVVLPEKDEIVERATSNIPNVKTTLVGTLNVYEILKYKTLILTKDAVAKILRGSMRTGFPDAGWPGKRLLRCGALLRLLRGRRSLR